MNLSNISLKSLFRQKGKKIFLIIAMVISLTTVLTLYSYVESQRLDIEKQFDEFGANIVITPKSDSLVLSYGGVNISGIVTSLEEIEYSDISEINNIENYENIRAISPKLIRQVMEQKMLEVVQVKNLSITSWSMLVVLCGLLIFSTVTGSISDRKHEIGIFRAIGFTKSNIMQIILTESLLISVFSGVVGIMLTYLSVNLILPNIIEMNTENFAVNIWFALTGAISIMILGL
jgi:ABC-type antimicrobial peptide transport system permease subunit